MDDGLEDSRPNELPLDELKLRLAASRRKVDELLSSIESVIDELSATVSDQKSDYNRMKQLFMWFRRVFIQHREEEEAGLCITDGVRRRCLKWEQEHGLLLDLLDDLKCQSERLFKGASADSHKMRRLAELLDWLDRQLNEQIYHENSDLLPRLRGMAVM